MARYRYSLARPGREAATGVVEAASPAEAATAAFRPGWTVVRIELEAGGYWRDLLSRDASFRRAIDDRVLASLARQWALLVDAGVPVPVAVELSGHSRPRRLRAVIDAISGRLRSGSGLASALGASGAFPPPFVATVGAAEEAGYLAAALARAAEDAQAAAANAGRIRNALIYPVFVVLAATLATGILLALVVPAIETLTEDVAAADLPLVTRLLVGASRAVRGAVLPVSAGTAVAVVFAGLAGRTDLGRLVAGRLLLATPVIGRIARLRDTGDYTAALSRMLAGGVGIDRAQALAATVAANRQVRVRLSAVGPAIAAGTRLSSALQASGLFDGEAIALVRSGEAGGRLADVLAAVAALSRSEADRLAEGVTASLGPSLTILFGLLAGFIVYAMMTSILSVNELAYR